MPKLDASQACSRSGGTGAAGLAVAGCGDEDDPRAEGRDAELLDRAAERRGRCSAADLRRRSTTAATRAIRRVEQFRDASSARLDELDRLGATAGGRAPTARSPPAAAIAAANAAIAAYREGVRLVSTTELRATAIQFLTQVAAEQAVLRGLAGRGPEPGARSSPACKEKPYVATDDDDDADDHLDDDEHLDLDDLDHRPRPRTADERARPTAAARRCAEARSPPARSPPAACSARPSRRRSRPRTTTCATSSSRRSASSRSRCSPTRPPPSRPTPNATASCSRTSATRSRRTRPRCARALDSLGFDPPDAPDSPDDTGVFDDVDGLDDDAATELKELLGQRRRRERRRRASSSCLADLESRQIAYYVDRGAAARQRRPVDDQRRDRRLPGRSTSSCCASELGDIAGGRRARRRRDRRPARRRRRAPRTRVERRARAATGRGLALRADPLDGRPGRQLRRLRPRRDRDEDLRRGRGDRRDPPLRPAASSPPASTG